MSREGERERERERDTLCQDKVVRDERTEKREERGTNNVKKKDKEQRKRTRNTVLKTKRAHSHVYAHFCFMEMVFELFLVTDVSALFCHIQGCRMW